MPALVTAVLGVPVWMLVSWSVLRFWPAWRWVPTWFYICWLGVVVAEFVTLGAMFLLPAGSGDDGDLGSGMFTVVLAVSAFPSAFVLAVLFVLPRGRRSIELSVE